MITHLNFFGIQVHIVLESRGLGSLSWICYQLGKWQDSVALASTQSDKERNQTPIAERINASWFPQTEVIQAHKVWHTAVHLKLTWTLPVFIYLHLSQAGRKARAWESYPSILITKASRFWTKSILPLNSWQSINLGSCQLTILTHKWQKNDKI